MQVGDTPLHIASQKGHRELVEILTRSGADFTIVNKVRKLVLCAHRMSFHYTHIHMYTKSISQDIDDIGLILN